MLKIKMHFSYGDFTRAGEHALYMYGLPGTAEIQKTTTVRGWGHRFNRNTLVLWALVYTLTRVILHCLISKCSLIINADKSVQLSSVLSTCMHPVRDDI
jgi:hypothetical protein